MTKPHLPDDCIYYILDGLRYYRSTLFNCLLVNRFWCKTTVPLLYSDPFSDFYFKNKNHASLITTLILCFNKIEILQLKNQINLINIKNNNNNIEINSHKHEPLFQYTKYLENFDYDKVNTMIFTWLNDRHYDSFVYENFIPMFYQSILRQCNNIKQLKIVLINYKDPIFTSNLTKLNSLTLHLEDSNSTENDEITQKSLSNIANVCLNLEKFEINYDRHDYDHYIPLYTHNKNTKKKIYAIIQKQNNLRIFKFSSSMISYNCPSFLNDTLLSLEYQKHSLVYIEFKRLEFGRNFSFKNFINLCNLKYLEFDQCNGLSLDQCEILKYASFKLKRLNFSINDFNDDIISLMIKYLGATLKELVLVFPTAPVIESISIYCPDLITLEIGISSEIDLLVFSYFKNLKIRILHINEACNGWTDCNIDMEIFKNLANNLPTSVKEISFRACNKISYFKKFLENCHNCLEIINLNFFKSFLEMTEFFGIFETFEIILNYTERINNNLKVLGISKLEALNDEELKLLNQIKAKGVSVVEDFHIVYKYGKMDCRCCDNSSIYYLQ